MYSQEKQNQVKPMLVSRTRLKALTFGPTYFHAPCDAKDLGCSVVGERQKMAPCPHGESMSLEAAVSEL